MSSALLHRHKRALGTLLIATAMLGAGASCASAAVGAPRAPQVKRYGVLERPPSGFAGRSRPSVLDRSHAATGQFLELARALKYGTTDEDLIAALDVLAERVKSRIEKTAERVDENARRADETGRGLEPFKRCLADGLRSAATSYRDKMLAARAVDELTAPDRDEANGFAEACLKGAFPHAEDAIDHVIRLVTRARDRVQDASGAAGSDAVLASWLEATAGELDPQPADRVDPVAVAVPVAHVDSGDAGPGTATLWALIGGGAVVLAVIVRLLRRRSRRASGGPG